MQKSTLFSLTVLFGIFTIHATAENLIYNSSFELANTGVYCLKYLRADTNPLLLFEGPTADQTTKISGNNSLRIPNRFNETTNLLFPEVSLESDTQYTLSVWMKSSASQYPVTLSLISASASEEWDHAQLKCVVSDTWTQYTLAFRTKKGRKNHWYALTIKSCDGKQPKGATLWLDDLQLCQGTIKKWESSVPIEVSIIPRQTLVDKPEEGSIKLPFTLTAVNYTNIPQEAELELSLRQDTSGNFPDELSRDKAEIVHRRKAILKPGLNKFGDIQISLDRFGAYQIHPVINGKNVSNYSEQFAVIGKYEQQPLDFSQDFCVSFNLGSGLIVAPPRWSETQYPGFRAADAGPDEFFKMLSRLGVRMIRDWGYPQSSLHWRLIEPEEGKFDFSVFDLQMKYLEKYGLELLPVIGASDTINYMNRSVSQGTLSGLPTWLLLRSEPHTAPQWLTNGKKQWFYPPLQNWRNMIRAFVNHSRSRIRYYEIMNEPNLCMTPDYYNKLLTVANEEIRNLAPKAKIVGICSTGDLGGDLQTFVSQTLNGGALEKIDILSFHPYSAPNLGSPNAADLQIAELHQQTSACGKKNFPLWNTEIYYLNNGRPDWFSQSHTLPEDAAKRFLTDLGEGLGQSCSLDSSQLFQSITPHTATSMVGYNRFIPNASLVVYNALARYFESAEPAGKIKYTNNSICYIFRKNGKLLAALWNYQGRRDLFANLTSFKIRDIFGNQLPSDEMCIDESPLYLWPDQLSESEFYSRLQSLTFRTENPVRLSNTARISEKTLFVRIFNTGSVLQNGMIGFHGKGWYTPHPQAVRIEPNSSILLRLPLKTTTDCKAPALLKLAIDGRQRDIPVDLIVNESVASEIHLPHAAGKLLVGEEKTELELTVTDISDSGANNGRHPWETDGIELFFDTNPLLLPEFHGRNYTAETFRIFINPRNPLPLTISGALAPTACDLKVELLPNGYHLRLVLTIKPKHYLGFELKLNDRINEKELKSEQLTKGEKPHLDRSVFGLAPIVP